MDADELANLVYVRNDSLTKSIVEDPTSILRGGKLTDSVNNVNDTKVIIPADNDCRCHLAGSDSYACAWCSSLRYLCDIFSNPETFDIEYGALNGYSIHIGRHDISQIKAIESPELIKLQSRYGQSCEYSTCVPAIAKDRKYIGLDSFSNLVIAQMLLGKLLMSQYKPIGYGIPSIFVGYKCGSVGISLDQHIPYAVDDIQWDSFQCEQAIVQLTTLLYKLKECDFSHGCPCSRHLRFDVVQDGNDESIIQVFMLGLKHASYDVTDDMFEGGHSPNRVRYYCRDHMTMSFYTKHQSKINTDGTYFILDSDSKLLATYLKYIGIPFYTDALDMYCFVLSLMMNEDFYSASVDSNWWKSMWTPDDLPTINSRITSFRNSRPDREVTTSQLMNLLMGLQLRCGLVTHMYSLFV